MDGENPRRRVMNQMFREPSGIAVESRDKGVLAWDEDIDYLADAIAASGPILYRALVATGPTPGNATDPDGSGAICLGNGAGRDGAAVGSQRTASRPPPQSGELDWFWNCPLDGGSRVTSFNFQWRPSATAAWSASIVVTTPRQVLTGLVNGNSYQARVQAVTAFGESPWSQIGSGSPSGTVPGGGPTLALRATAGDASVSLNWLEPDDGGLTITSYLCPVEIKQPKFFIQPAGEFGRHRPDDFLTDQRHHLFLPRASDQQRGQRRVVERSQRHAGSGRSGSYAAG